ncbi:hypothetical protein BH11PSE13_BH11PSE13_21610 [soil metagenome]
MKRDSKLRKSIGGCLVAFGISVAGASVTGQAMAGCGMPARVDKVPQSWTPQGVAAAVQAQDLAQKTADLNDKNKADSNKEGPNAGIVGLWRLTFIADDSVNPPIFPAGTIVDFGTSQWHSDNTEFLISGGRAPSTGDVCMGVWRQTGRSSYKLRHIALAYRSSDSPPEMAITPAVFVGPAIMTQTVTLGRSQNSYKGTFTIDQYADDEVTLLQHIGGQVVATRFTVD